MIFNNTSFFLSLFFGHYQKKIKGRGKIEETGKEGAERQLKFKQEDEVYKFLS